MIETIHAQSAAAGRLPPEVRARFALGELDRLHPPAPSIIAWLWDRASEGQIADLERLLAVDVRFRWRLVRLLQAGAHDDLPDASRLRLRVRECSAVRVGAGILGLFDHLRGLNSAAGFGLEWDGFGRRSLTTACAAVRLARATNQASRALEAFGAGLLHDLGAIGLSCLFPRGYARVVRRCAVQRIDELDAERAILGVSHCDLGDRLARHWHLPAWLVACAGRHDASGSSPADDDRDGALVDVVRLADRIARERTSPWGTGKRPTDDSSLLAWAGLTWDDVEALSLGIADDVNACLSIVTGSTSPARPHQPAEQEDAFFAGALLHSDRVSQGAMDRRIENRERETGNRGRGGSWVHPGRVLREHGVPTDVSPLVQGASTGKTSTPLPRKLPQVGVQLGRGAVARGPVRDSLGTLAETMDACRVIMKAAGHALGVDGRLIVFRLDRSRGYCLFADSQSPRGSSSIIKVSPADEPLGQLRVALTRPPAWLSPVGDRLGQEPGDRGILLAPMVHGGRLIGGVLFVSPNDPVTTATANAAWMLHHDLFASLLLAEEQLSAMRRDVGQRFASIRDATNEPAGESREWLARIASVASGAAHELNTPLAVISGRAQLLGSAIQDERQRKALDTIVTQAALASDLVSDLLAVGNPPQASVRPISLTLLLEQLRVDVLAERSISPGRFDIRLADSGVSVVADAEQLKQILAAVLSNAVEHSGDENVRIVVNSASRASDDTVVLSVVDNGRGMAPEVLARARDPFFSIRGSGRGRGLGLARAYSLALNNGGDLWIESRPGQGTAVFVALPSDRGGRA